MDWSISEEMRGIYSSLRDLNLRGMGFLILVQLFFVLELILHFWCYLVIHPRVLLVRKSWSLLDPDVLPCKSLFYRRVIVIWIGIYLWGIKSPPRKYVRIFMSECIMMTVWMSKVCAKCWRSDVGGMRWPASSTDAADARYRDSDLIVASRCASWTFVSVKNKLDVSFLRKLNR